MQSSILRSPLERGRVRLTNRIIFPGHQRLLSEDGVVGPRLRAYYAERARGGTGAVVVEGAAVHPTTKKFPAYLMAGKGVRFLPHTNVIGAENGRVQLRDTLSEEARWIDADLTVAALGRSAEAAMLEETERLGGDASCVGDSLAAPHDPRGGT